MGVKAADGSDGAGPSTAASGETEAVLVNILSSCAAGKGESIGARAADSSDAVTERVPRRLLQARRGLRLRARPLVLLRRAAAWASRLLTAATMQGPRLLLKARQRLCH